MGRKVDGGAAVTVEPPGAGQDDGGPQGERRLRLLLENAPDVVIVLGPDLTVSYASPSIERALGYSPEGVSHSAFPLYLHPEERAWVRDVLLGGRGAAGGLPTPLEFRVRHVDRSWRRFAVSGADLRDDPAVEGLVLYLRDVTEDRALVDELTRRSFHDVLTGLPNRALFVNRLEHALARVARHRGPVTVLFLDLDDFKAVNDGFGHEVGDELLVAFGKRLQACVRPGDTVSRFGGDEFAVLLEHAAAPADPAGAVERITRASREPVAVRGHTLFVTASIGGVTSGPGHDRAEDLLRRADEAMYRAKRAGKARFELFEEGAPGEAPVSGRPPLEDELRRAIERGELRVHYQPEVVLGDGGIVGMEALLRWEYPRRGRVPAAEVVAIAEMSGLIAPIGRWVLEEACRQAAVWQDRYPEGPPLVSVNLSEKQLRQPALADEVGAAIEGTRLDPRNLALEVSEGSMTHDAPQAASTIEKLRGLGVGLVVDDFGKERVSLSGLARFPADMIKIDRRLIDELEHDGGEGAELLVSAMVGFARAMGIPAFAEGVETARQVEKLRRMGCNLAQGFYFWKALPGDAATELLDNEREANAVRRTLWDAIGRGGA